MTAKKLNWRQARWSLLLAWFNFLLHHRPGKTMGKSDALSQRSDHGSGVNNNDNLTLLTPNLFAIRALKGLEVSWEEKDILKEIRCGMEMEDQEDVVVKVIQKLKKSLTKSMKSSEWSMKNSLLYYRGKFIFPNLTSAAESLLFVMTQILQDTLADGKPWNSFQGIIGGNRCLGT